MYKALESFTTKNYDVKRKQILEDDFTTQDEINEFLEIGYIEEYDGTLEISENGIYDVKEYDNADVNVSGSDPVLQSKTITITENGTQTVSPDTGYDGLSSVSVTTDVSGGGEPGIITNSFTGYSLNNNIGFAGRFMKSLVIQLTRPGWNFLFYDFQGLEDLNFEYSEKPTTMYATFRGCLKLKEIPTIDTSETTMLANTFQDCREITELPITVTTKTTNASQMCNGCSKLTTVPYLDLSNVTGEGTVLMFGGCPLLSENSLNNILASLATATQVDQSRKTLNNTGLTRAQATTCQGLSNYQAFLDAGWTTGY